jgi:hypothetical protein
MLICCVATATLIGFDVSKARFRVRPTPQDFVFLLPLRSLICSLTHSETEKAQYALLSSLLRSAQQASTEARKNVNLPDSLASHVERSHHDYPVN